MKPWSPTDSRGSPRTAHREAHSGQRRPSARPGRTGGSERECGRPATYRLLYETRQTPVGPERLAGHPAGPLVRGFHDALTACEEAGWRVRGTRSEAPYVLWSAVHCRVMLWQVMPSRKDTGRLDRFVDEMLQLLLER